MTIPLTVVFSAFGTTILSLQAIQVRIDAIINTIAITVARIAKPFTSFFPPKYATRASPNELIMSHAHLAKIRGIAEI